MYFAAALLVVGSRYARRRRAVIKLISMACGLADKRRVSPRPGLVRLAQAAKVDRSVRVETVETNCGTLFSGTRARGAHGSKLRKAFQPTEPHPCPKTTKPVSAQSSTSAVL